MPKRTEPRVESKSSYDLKDNKINKTVSQRDGVGHRHLWLGARVGTEVLLIYLEKQKKM